MRNRTEILKELVLIQQDIKVLEKELSQYSWDSETPLYKVSVIDLSNVLKRIINKEISFESIINWANALECRDDIEFENEKIQEIIFELANPEINGEITNERLNKFIFDLSNNYEGS